MAWYKSKKGWGAVVASLYVWLDSYGYVVSLHDIGGYTWTHRIRVMQFLPWVFLLIAILFFERNRKSSGRPKSHDPSTLRGRTLLLRDDMQAFLDSAPPMKTLSREQAKGMTTKEILRFGSNDDRIPKLAHGYWLRFDSRAKAILHEFGERNASPIGFAALVDYEMPNEEFYSKMIKALTEIAEMPQAVD